jgi:hypothetical protein
MTRRPQPTRTVVALATAGLLLGLAPAAQATTQCDTDPNAVPFQATLDPTTLNKLLARLGSIEVPPPDTALTLDGFCVDHRIPITLDVLSLPVATSPFTVTTVPGSVAVQLDIPGPFGVSVNGSNYQAVNCASFCVIEVPYVGEIFNGCQVEAGIVRPILGVLNASASWDDIRLTQTVDTCVLGDCTAVHPMESTQATLFGFDIDATGFGSCEVCLDFPPPFDFLDTCVDPCQGIDPILTSLIRPVLEDAVEGALLNRAGEGILINVFSRQIVKDGCADIPEVRECKNPAPVETGGLIRAPRDHGLNGILYALPLVAAVGLGLRLRRLGSAPKSSD